MKKAYGGVVVDDFGRVLLREPAWHYNDQVWTFAKGGPKRGESPEQTALREVLEETGVQAQIVMKIPGVFAGATTSNEFFLMRPIGDTGHFDWETWAVRWATQEEAARLISLTLKAKRRERDLQVLASAFTLYYSRREPSP
jgi:8-oxo-dGTP pyrophosphatase MutT (NUDIX family)